jgi:2-keto-4-pentenoate hydratase
MHLTVWPLLAGLALFSVLRTVVMLAGTQDRNSRKPNRPERVDMTILLSVFGLGIAVASPGLSSCHGRCMRSWTCSCSCRSRASFWRAPDEPRRLPPAHHPPRRSGTDTAKPVGKRMTDHAQPPAPHHPAQDIPGLAERILQAFASHHRAVCPTVPANATEAYAVQAAVAAARGRVAGFKTARKPGQSQIMAPIMACDVTDSGARVASRFGGPLGVELELGLRILAPLPDPADPGFVAALGACVEPLAVIELVDTRLDGPGTDDPLVKLADAQINASLVIGPVLTGWDGGALTGAAARMRAGDAVLLDGPGHIPGGDARDTLRALAAMAGDHCGGLQPGQVVITGSLHPLTYVAPGTPVEGWIAGCGSVSVTIA